MEEADGAAHLKWDALRSHHRISGSRQLLLEGRLKCRRRIVLFRGLPARHGVKDLFDAMRFRRIFFEAII